MRQFFFAIAPLMITSCTTSKPPQERLAAVPEKPVTSSVPSIPPSASFAPPNPPAPSSSDSVSPEQDPPPEDPKPTLDLGDGTKIVVDLDFDDPPNPPQLAIELQRDKKAIVRREGWAAITHFDTKKLHPCDTWEAQIVREDSGTSVVRISLVCRTGEDFFTGSEVAVLVKPDSLDTIWAGAADHFENSMDSCSSSRHVAFKIIPPKTLEKTIVEETRWFEQNFDDELKARLKRECKVGKKQRVERTTLR